MFTRTNNGWMVVDAESAARLIPLLLGAIKYESDYATVFAAQLLHEYGETIHDDGNYGYDYWGLIEYDGNRWLVEANNAWARVYDPSEADEDHPVRAALAAG